jgi:hypothetical protein
MLPSTALQRLKDISRHGNRITEVHKELADFVGWRRGQGDKREFWIRPFGAIFSTMSRMSR